MLLHCSRVQAAFVPEEVCLASPGPTKVLLDEHGGTFVLKVGDLKVMEITGAGEESGIFWEIDLSSPETLIKEMEEFAARHSLPLTPGGPAPPELVESAILAACHIPEKNLFVFVEEPQLKARTAAAATLKLTVPGPFRSRRVSSQEADVVIHLNAAAMARLLSYFIALVREIL